MDVSIVIPTHNKQQELRRCLHAVLAQRTSRQCEVLVCDDGSTDGTAAMLAEWSGREPRLHYLRQRDGVHGPAAARNLGIRHARAPLVAMTDDDTIPDECWLESLCAAAERHGVAGAEGRVTAGRPFGPWETAPVNETGGVYLTCNALYRRDALAAAGGFDERFPFAAFEDCDLAAKLKQHGEIAWAPDAVVVHPPRSMSWCSAVRRLAHWPWIMVTGRRYGYLAWPSFPTRHPRGRVLRNAVIVLPMGRLLAALRAFGRWPAQALRAAVWAVIEPVVALWHVVPQLLRFDLDSAAFHMDFLDLAPRAAKVALVVVNYKQPEHLVRCIESFQRADYPGLRLIVVESAAEPAALEALQKRLPGVDWIAAAENVGYTGGNNLGIRRALELGCDYILLANADTECIAPDFIRRLVAFCELNLRVALAGPRVQLRERGRVQNTVLEYPSLWRGFVNWFGFRLFPEKYMRSGGEVRRAEMLNGVCVLLRAEAVRRVGAFDPWYFMYIEDADLGLRLRRAGWEVAYAPIDSILHHQPEPGYEMDSRVSLLLRRNSVYFLQKHHRPIQAWALAVANLAVAFGRACATTSAETFRRRFDFFCALWRVFRRLLWTGAVGAHAETK